jgi:hypothetical protein
MSSTWTRFLHRPARAEHGALVHGDVSELAESVAAYLAAGFAQGEPAVVIAQERHWSVVEAHLAARGPHARELEAQGLLRRLDAEATLASLLVRGHPAPGLFLQVVGDVLDEVAERFPGRRVRAFGEMVDLLAKRGDTESAVELEDLWSALLHSRRFSLLCGYEADLFDLESQAWLLPEICRTHAHVHPSSDPARLHRAVDGALVETLGSHASKVYALANGHLADESVPIAERALMWVSAEMPAHAERILARARARYADAA